MVDSIKLETIERENFGKGAARQLRRDGKVPAVVYGHSGETAHIALDAHETNLAIRGNANALLTVTIGGKETLTLVKDIQRNPVSRILEHIDLLGIKAGETVSVEVPVVTVGEPAGDGVVTVETLHLTVNAPVTAIPESIEIDVEEKEEGTQIRVADITLPEGVTTEMDPEDLIVSVNAPIVDAELEAADAAAAEEAAEESAEDAGETSEEASEEAADESAE